MGSGLYSISLDRTGFPLLQRQNWHFAIALLPVSKYQFERFMVAHGPQGGLYSDAWYREQLRLNPRCSWRRGQERPWELFLTGLEPEAIQPFLRYLGREYRLPTVAEWQTLLAVAGEVMAMRSELSDACRQAPAPVRRWIEQGLFPLAREGLLERVMEGGKPRFIGRPWPGLLPNTWTAGTMRDVHWELCRRAVGFRVVKEKVNV